ncbi:hypothetical protein [Mycobacterium spongiae]|uniref:Uncharacterized protein n=1 Tax=Mycobacterium spongiae TaxID=886343 RepID=A0A975JZY4_9MYCO|nr:hypothetical protein [Mycobacterium spongiae]QUR68149.1 hypothetical protein F6B93_14595 [Mycobacterium spongiae]
MKQPVNTGKAVTVSVALAGRSDVGAGAALAQPAATDMPQRGVVPLSCDDGGESYDSWLTLGIGTGNESGQLLLPRRTAGDAL